MKIYLLHIQFVIVLLILQAAAASTQENSNLESTKEVEDIAGEFSISGSLDTYFHNTIGTIEKAPPTSFANLPDFSSGMINQIASYSGKRSGFVADLVFGPRGSDILFNSSKYINPAENGSAHIINQTFTKKSSGEVLNTMSSFNFAVVNGLPLINFSERPRRSTKIY